MSRKTKKIDKVASLAASEERRFGEQTGRSQQALAEQLERLGELRAYRLNYARQKPAATGVSSVRWQDYQNFLQRLDQAVQSQHQIIRECEQNLDAHRNRWMAKRQKLESLERLLEKCWQRDAAYKARLEQRELDDLQLADNPILKSDLNR